MIDKTRLGVDFFDERFGGIFRKRCALCVGRHGSGKTVLALQALIQSAREGERGLLLSAWRAPDLSIAAESWGFPLAHELSIGQVVLLEYGDIMPTPAFEKNMVLPPGSFDEFKEIIEANAIRRVVIDTVLPWVAIPDATQMTKHIYTLVHSLETLGVTALLTLPRPVSPMAFSLRNALEEQIPIVFTLDQDSTGLRSLLVNKYLGDKNLPPQIPFSILPGVGICETTASPVPPPSAAKASEPAAPVETPPPSAPRGPIRFSTAFKDPPPST
ncbi:MAG: hypothetical protein KBA51_07635 [Kiritimatiellae bacterium]|nr:hypothetical protein [Kiritimatiellia bacterium]